MTAPVQRSAPLARPGFLVALLLAWFFGQAISVSPGLGITADEIIHITAGYSYWKFDDYRLQPENGNLPQRLVALPALWLNPAWIPAGNHHWQEADARGVGHTFFFHAGNQPGLLLFGARVMIALLGVATGLLVFVFARYVFGLRGGLLATALFAVNPGLLAQGGLATSDLAASCGFLAATLSGWRLLHRVNVSRVALFGLAGGALALAKYSAPIFAFMFAAMLAVRLARRTPLVVSLGSRRWHVRGWRAGAALVSAATGAALVALGLIWSAYGFRYDVARPGQQADFPVSWGTVLPRTPFLLSTPTLSGQRNPDSVLITRNAVSAAVEWASSHRILPEAWLYGFAHAYTYSQWRPAYFLGEYRTVGWRSYFPVIFLTKNPLPLLALYLLALLILLRLSRFTTTPRRHWYRLAPVLCLIGVYTAFAVTSRLNIGYRHLLPVDIALCIVTGVLALVPAVSSRWFWVLTGTLVALTNLAGWLARPSYLAYFNALLGGSREAHHFFVDSSLDWGQGLPQLKQWLDANPPAAPVYLAYFGSDSPGYEGLRVTRFGDQFFDQEPRQELRDLAPGTYIVSATLLQGVYTLTPGPWTLDHELAYRRLRQQVHAPDSATLPKSVWLEWDQARFGRLCSYLRTRKPDAQPEPSLLVYRLSAGDLAQALGYRTN